jgi:outer membrane protein assembly factor BamA
MGLFSNFARVEGQAYWFLGAPSWMPERSTFAVSTRMGYAMPFNSISDYDTPNSVIDPTLFGPQAQELSDIDSDSKLPLTERYFLGGLGRFQMRGFKARSLGPRRPILTNTGPDSGRYRPVGWDASGMVCADTLDPPLGLLNPGNINQGNLDGQCNDIDDEDLDEFEDLDESDVIGGNKFISSSLEYRFPISDTIGLQGVAFFDVGNAFAEGENLFDIGEWRYGTGFGVQWFSPFGPLAVVLGFPLDRYSEIEDSPVFEFSVGGSGF